MINPRDLLELAAEWARAITETAREWIMERFGR